MATKQIKCCNTGENSKISDSLDRGSRKLLLRKMKELKLLPLILYMEMHNILMLLAMLNDKCDVVLNETLQHARACSNSREQ